MYISMLGVGNFKCQALGFIHDVSQTQLVQTGCSQDHSFYHVHIFIKSQSTLFCIWLPPDKLKSDCVSAVNAKWCPLNHMYLQETAMFSIETEIAWDS